MNQTSAAHYVAEMAGFMPQAPADRDNHDLLPKCPCGTHSGDGKTPADLTSPSSGLALKISNLEEILAASTSDSCQHGRFFYFLCRREPDAPNQSLTRRCLMLFSPSHSIKK